MNNRANVAVFGGAFNPPTLAHQQIANYIVDNEYADVVWLMPVFKHRFGKQMASFEHRFNMCNIISKISTILSNYNITKNNLETSNFEKLRSPNGTFELMNMLRISHTYNFSVIIGQDNADQIYKWKNWEKLIKLFKFIVFPRKNQYALSLEDLKFKKSKFNNWYKKKPHAFLTNFQLNSSSSTLVRKYFEMRLPECAKLHLNDIVYQYILKKELYAKRTSN